MVGLVPPGRGRRSRPYGHRGRTGAARRPVRGRLLRLGQGAGALLRAGRFRELDLENLIDELTPTLHRDLEDELAELYTRSRRLAEGALRAYGEGGAADRLPESCPYSLDQVTGEWLP